MINRKIGFIGCGNMGGAIIKGIIQSKAADAGNIYVREMSEAAREKVSALGVNLVGSVEELGHTADIIMLCVKPQNMEAALKEAGEAFDGKCVISIAAGVKTASLRKWIKGNPRILRTMPNTPALVLSGAFGLCNDSDLTDEEKAIAEQIFSSIGIVEWVPEKLIDAVCGLSGSGPAYVAMFIEALGDAGVRDGLPRATAYKLAAQTVYGTARMILENGTHPGVLKDMVTSPAGTTIEGCYNLEKGGFRAAVMDAVRAGTKRSQDMG